jgi:hypothetical protein
MNPITDIVFSITWVLLLVWAIRTISRGWNIKSNSNINGMWTTKVTKVQHPEMIDVKPGEELMGVTFGNRSCDLEDYKDLQERIEQLKEELEDEDDDGDIVVRL